MCLLTPVHTSMAFVYETGGSCALIPDVWVDMVRRVVTPRETLAEERQNVGLDGINRALEQSQTEKKKSIIITNNGTNVMLSYLAGMAFWSSQNETQETITSMQQGT